MSQRIRDIVFALLLALLLLIGVQLIQIGRQLTRANNLAEQTGRNSAENNRILNERTEMIRAIEQCACRR